MIIFYFLTLALFASDGLQTANSITTDTIHYALKGMIHSLSNTALSEALLPPDVLSKSSLKRPLQNSPKDQLHTKVAKISSAAHIHSTKTRFKALTSFPEDQNIPPGTTHCHKEGASPLQEVPVSPTLVVLDSVFTSLLNAPTNAPRITKHLQQALSAPEGSTMSDLLSSLLDTCNTPQHLQEVAKIQMIGELCIALTAQPPLNLDLLTEIKKYYPNHTQIDSMHTTWLQLKLTYALHNLIQHLPAPLETVPTLQQFNLASLPLEEALLHTYDLLQGRAASDVLIPSPSPNSPMQLLCQPTPHCESILATLYRLENPDPLLSTGTLTPECLLAKFQQIISTPSQIRIAITELFYIHQAASDHAPSLAKMIAAINEHLTPEPLTRHRSERAVLAAIGELSVFLLSSPPLETSLFQEVHDRFFALKKDSQTRGFCRTQKEAYILRLQTKLAYALQILQNSLPSSVHTLGQMISHLNIPDSEVDSALQVATDFIEKNTNHPDLSNIVQNSATYLCVPRRTTLPFILSTLQCLEDSNGAHPLSNEVAPASHILFPQVSSHINPLTNSIAKPTTFLHTSFLKQKIHSILHNPAQTLKVLSDIYEVLYQSPSPHRSFFHAFSAIYKKDSSGTRQSLAIRIIGELCTFLLSDPTFDIQLFKDLQTQLTQPISNSQKQPDNMFLTLRTLRMHMKATYSLQNLRENLILPTQTLQEMLNTLDITASNPECALDQAKALCTGQKTNKSLAYPLKTSPSLSLCTHKCSVADALLAAERAYISRTQNSETV